MLLAGVLVAAVAAPAQANLVLGGDFDSDPDLSQWTLGGSSNPVITIGEAYGLGPQAGAGYLGFTGNGVTEDGFVRQSITGLTSGEDYRLNFYWGGRGVAGSAVTASLTNGTGTSGDIYQQEFNVGTIGVWTPEEVVFNAPSSTVTLQFQETSANSVNKGPGIDTVSLLLDGPPPPPPPTVTTVFDSFEFQTAADNGESPATSGQFAGPLYVRERANESSPQLEVQAFLQFDLSGLSDLEIESAILKLHENDKLNSVNSASLFLGKVPYSWDPVTNKPVFDEAALPGEFVFGNNGPASAGPAVDIDFEIDVTQFVKDWQADPSSNHGFRISIDDAYVGAAFNETGANAPILIVTQIVPEPAALVVWALLAAAVVALGRRKLRAERS
jgi:hypothetical protein